MKHQNIFSTIFFEDNDSLSHGLTTHRNETVMHMEYQRNSVAGKLLRLASRTPFTMLSSSRPLWLRIVVCLLLSRFQEAEGEIRSFSLLLEPAVSPVITSN